MADKLSLEAIKAAQKVLDEAGVPTKGRTLRVSQQQLDQLKKETPIKRMRIYGCKIEVY